MNFVDGFPVTLRKGKILLGDGRTRHVKDAQALADAGLISIDWIETERYVSPRGHKYTRKVIVYSLCGMGETLAAELREKQ